MKRWKEESLLSKLPDHIIYRILSFLPDIKQVTRLKLLSKSWLRTCCSFPILDFCGKCSYANPREVGKTKQFIEFVDKTMTRFWSSNMVIEKLRLEVSFEKMDENYLNNVLVALLDKWVHIALDSRVQDLVQRLWVKKERYYWRYHVPKRVLSSSYGLVRSLSLGEQVCLPHDNDLSLSSLRSLDIFQVVDMDNNEFQGLLRACPAIENLTVESEYMDKIEVSGLHHLKMISIERCHGFPDRFDVKIEAPSLETLWLSGFGYGKTCHTDTMDIVQCCNLKCLKLTRCCNLLNAQLHGLLSKFPLLESLELHDCSITDVKIANPRLKKIDIQYSNDLGRVEIHSPDVMFFRWEDTDGNLLPSIWANNCPRYVEAAFNIGDPKFLYPYWFRGLRQTMLRISSTNTHTSLSIKMIWKKRRCIEQLLAPLIPTHTHLRLPACEIDHLNLAVAAPDLNYPVFFSHLFSKIHPSTLQASLLNNYHGSSFLKFLCEDLANRGRDPRCPACSNHVKCWKHQLKAVEIECIRGLHHKGPLDWSTVLKQLPTLTADHKIRFRLQWAHI